MENMTPLQTLASRRDKNSRAECMSDLFYPLYPFVLESAWVLVDVLPPVASAAASRTYVGWSDFCPSMLKRRWFFS